MKIIRNILIGLLAILIALGVAVFFLYITITRGPLPTHSGEVAISARSVSLAGQTVSVAAPRTGAEIIRDEWGVPHIYADNRYDLYFAQGYTQAQDRWWQMAFYRAIGSGRIQELTGYNRAALGNDVFIRTVGWRRSAERDLREVYDAETIAIFQAFADGVNAYLASRPQDDLAIAYRLLSINGVRGVVEPWTPADTIVFGKVMAWNLSGGMRDIGRAELIEQLGPQRFAAYEPAWPHGLKPTILHASDLPIVPATANRPAEAAFTPLSAPVTLAGSVAPQVNFGFGVGPEIGSNNWVVSGDKTASGKPLLANDPHLGIQMPSIWYEIGLHCQPVSADCALNARGFTFALTPGIVTGHNGHIAWGVTNVGPDVIDLYRLKINPENPLQYEWDGAWRDMTLHEEVIRFGNNREPLTIRVRETHLGPVINDNALDDDGSPLGFNNENPLALRWVMLDPDQTIAAFMKLNYATNWDEFRDALSYYGAPSQNFVYADVEGNIGYLAPGRIPIRPASNTGLTPVDGTTSATEWLGYIPYDLLPRAFNPARGYIASANQAVTPPEYTAQLADLLADTFGADANYAISRDWDYGYRGQRIEELLRGEDQHTLDTLRAIQTDNKNLSAAEILPFLLALDFEDAALNDARDWLADWDMKMDADSGQAALYAQFWARLVHHLFNTRLGDDAVSSGGGQQMWAAYLLLQDPDNAWWEGQARDDVLRLAFSEAHAATVTALGADRAAWRWGTLHSATFVSQPLGVSGIDLIENLVNRGPFAVGGGTSIVNATGWDLSGGSYALVSVPSYRMLIDLGDLDASLNIHTTGQSGHPFSPHYDDMIAPWAALAYKPMRYSRAQVEAAGVSTLRLR